jgi:hypothetical protein
VLQTFNAKPVRPFDAKVSVSLFFFFDAKVTVPLCISLSLPSLLSRTHARTHARARTHTHTHTQDSGVYFAMFYGMTLFIFLGWFYYLFFILSVPGMDVPCCNFARLIRCSLSLNFFVAAIRRCL